MFININTSIPYGGKLWCPYNLAKLTINQKFAKFSPSKLYTSIVKSHVNNEQIDYKVFFRHVPNNIQLGTIDHLLESHDLVDHVNFLFFVHKVAKSPSAKGTSHNIDCYSQ